jgi:hypothetical protein
MMSGIDSMAASYTGLELVDYQVSQEDICADIGFCSDVLCEEVCAELCWIVGGGGGSCDGTTCCCDCL